MKKSILFLIFTISVLMISAPVFSADLDGCTITRIGAYPGLINADLNRSGYPVFLSHPSWPETSRMFYLSADLGDGGLATLLTAFSLEKPIWVRIGPSAEASADPGSIITVIYVNQ